MPKAHTGQSSLTLFSAFQKLPPVYDIIFQHLSPLNLIRVSHTCKDARNAIRSYMRRSFSINRLLSRFFRDPHNFRSLQARTGTLISGSQALQFFGRWVWAGSDIDIYTCPQHSLEVGRWLQDEGYIFTPNSYQPINYTVAAGCIDEDDLRMTTVRAWDPRNPTDVKHEQLYAISGIRSVLSFEKQVGPETLTVQIIAASYSPIDVVLHFHSTAVMNFISWNKAYSLYPYATLEKSRSLICFIPKTPCPRYDKAMVKYHHRGFTMIADLYAHEDPRCAFRLGTRFVGDGHTFIVPLDTNGVDIPVSACEQSPVFDPYLLNGWEVKKMGSASFMHDDTKFEMDTRIIWSSILRYTYTAPYAFTQYARLFFVGQGKMEHAKLSQSEVLMFAGKIKPKPNFWKFYDEELAEILHQWIRDGQQQPAPPTPRLYF